MPGPCPVCADKDQGAVCYYPVWVCREPWPLRHKSRHRLSPAGGGLPGSAPKVGASLRLRTPRAEARQPNPVTLTRPRFGGLSAAGRRRVHVPSARTRAALPPRRHGEHRILRWSASPRSRVGIGPESEPRSEVGASRARWPQPQCVYRWGRSPSSSTCRSQIRPSRAQVASLNPGSAPERQRDRRPLTARRTCSERGRRWRSSGPCALWPCSPAPASGQVGLVSGRRWSAAASLIGGSAQCRGVTPRASPELSCLIGQAVRKRVRLSG